MNTKSPKIDNSAGWKLLRATLKLQRRGLAIATVMGLLWSLGKIVVPQLTKFTIDKAILHHGSLLTWTLLIMAAAVVLGVLSGLRRFYSFSESRLTESRLRERLFAHLQGLDVAYHDRSQTGQLMSRASSDMQQIQSFIVMVPITIANIAMVLSVVVVLLVADPHLALLALAPLPLINFVTKAFSSRIHPASLVVQQEQAELANVVEESVSGVRVIKGFGAEPVQFAKLSKEANDIRTASMRAARIRSVFMPFIDLLPSLSLIAVLGIGGHRVISGDMTLGGFVAFNTYLALLVQPLRTMGMTVAFAQRAASALIRIDEILSAESQIVDPSHPKALPAADIARPVGALSFRNVTFGYDTGETHVDVLSELSLDIAPGESVAVVGATGSGKSTITRLLLRFYDPISGAITLDGVDIRDLRLNDLRRSIAVVFEETLLFNDTVSANIAFARPSVDMDVIERAAKLAGAHEFIMNLPEGYDTVLGERGFSLSGGQRQRVAIARAIVADPRVLVLDDATSAVDPTKEHEIRDALATVMRGRTTIVIAHRPATIELASKVVLLDGGHIAASGTHRELLDSNETYRKVLAAYSAGAEEALS